MKAKSIKGKSPQEIRTTLGNAMSDGFKPTLAFVFISIQNDLKAVSELLDKEGIQIFGATTGGEFIDGNIESGSVAILLLDMKPEYFALLLEDYRDRDPEAVARQMSAKAKETFKNPSFIISASINARENSEALGEPLIKAMESVTGKETNIWGGRAGDDFVFNDTVVFNNNLSTERGILMLVLDGDKMIARGEAASGLKAVGTEKIITKASGNWVYEIDHQPAAEMVLKYLGLKLSQEEAETFFPKEGIMFSVSRDKGDPVIRAVGVFNWKDKSFSTLGSIREGDRIRLTLPPDFELVEELSRNAEIISRQELPGTEALLMFSCVGRLGQFGPLIGDEIEGIRKAIGVPLAGFFTYGEFGRTRNGNNEFHTSTCCWVALKEK
ncbi:MAG TPA: FIST N-terminal domain-containing protein [Saprospiraceae bacterium]|nr:FIST N-terminal domain-containing protein [Saprospiraceae bacterium]